MCLRALIGPRLRGDQALIIDELFFVRGEDVEVGESAVDSDILLTLRRSFHLGEGAVRILDVEPVRRERQLGASINSAERLIPLRRQDVGVAVRIHEELIASQLIVEVEKRAAGVAVSSVDVARVIPDTHTRTRRRDLARTLHGVAVRLIEDEIVVVRLLSYDVHGEDDVLPRADVGVRETDGEIVLLKRNADQRLPAGSGILEFDLEVVVFRGIGSAVSRVIDIDGVVEVLCKRLAALRDLDREDELRGVDLARRGEAVEGDFLFEREFLCDLIHKRLIFLRQRSAFRCRRDGYHGDEIAHRTVLRVFRDDDLVELCGEGLRPRIRGVHIVLFRRIRLDCVVHDTLLRIVDEMVAVHEAFVVAVLGDVRTIVTRGKHLDGIVVRIGADESRQLPHDLALVYAAVHGAVIRLPGQLRRSHQHLGRDVGFETFVLGERTGVSLIAVGDELRVLVGAVLCDKLEPACGDAYARARIRRRKHCGVRELHRIRVTTGQESTRFIRRADVKRSGGIAVVRLAFCLDILCREADRHGIEIRRLFEHYDDLALLHLVVVVALQVVVAPIKASARRERDGDFDIMPVVPAVEIAYLHIREGLVGRLIRCARVDIADKFISLRVDGHTLSLRRCAEPRTAFGNGGLIVRLALDIDFELDGTRVDGKRAADLVFDRLITVRRDGIR